ncbi:hypothetical protein BKA93DRAFT_701164, partial [Sparassis latifolia]
IPSVYPEAVQNHSTFMTFTSAERLLHQAQANEALQDIRNKLGLQAFLFRKTAGTFGQSAKTRSGKILQTTRDKIDELRVEYECAREKLNILGEPLDSHNYQPLTTADCQPLKLWYDQEMPGQQKKEIPWIWCDGAY